LQRLTLQISSGFFIRLALGSRLKSHHLEVWEVMASIMEGGVFFKKNALALTGNAKLEIVKMRSAVSTNRDKK
jgi:hypothetical protein